MDNPEKLATLCTQHTRRIQKKNKKTPQKIKNKNKQVENVCNSRHIIRDIIQRQKYMISRPGLQPNIIRILCVFHT